MSTCLSLQAFLDHLRSCRPSQKVILSSAFGSLDGKEHVKAVYPVASWDDTSEYPDLTQVAHHGDMAMKITLMAEPFDEATEENFNRFVDQFTTQNGVERNSLDVKIITTIPGG